MAYQSRNPNENEGNQDQFMTGRRSSLSPDQQPRVFYRPEREEPGMSEVPIGGMSQPGMSQQGMNQSGINQQNMNNTQNMYSQQHQQPVYQNYQPQYQQYNPQQGSYYDGNMNGNMNPNQRTEPINKQEYPEQKPVGPIETKEEKKQHLIVRILGYLFVAFQAIALMAGLALAISGSMWYLQVRKRGLSDTLLGRFATWAIAGGVAVTLISCLGLVSAITRGRSGAVIYCILMLAVIGAQVYFLVRSQRLGHNFLQYASKAWDETTEPKRKLFQTWQKCCGFASAEDRAAEPCPVDAQRGCVVPYVALAKRWHGTIIKAIGVSMAVEIVLIILALVVTFIR